MPNTCVPPIYTTAPGTPDWWAAFKRTIKEICADVGEHGLDSVMQIAELRRIRLRARARALSVPGQGGRHGR
eukprot:4615245-Pleurochrysis_carterae.AAC.1